MKVYDTDLLSPTCSVPARGTCRSGAAGAVGRPARRRCCSRPAPANRAPRTPGTWWVLAGLRTAEHRFSPAMTAFGTARICHAYTLFATEHYASIARNITCLGLTDSINGSINSRSHAVALPARPFLRTLGYFQGRQPCRVHLAGRQGEWRGRGGARAASGQVRRLDDCVCLCRI